ncbi:MULTISPECIES: formate/nitrite transporter family protein [Dehalobacter]|jgi:formate/nitrite transporter|uniref:Formate/nitrite transporter family protein n=1 Tax=Dehalobacter restrictus TaxID=55583 RepID=A0A857DDM6_9FIRM|nr:MULTISPECIES: formate/nitrite transporter family protein [Dehalobacter]MCG1024134.1 formate/nitrite transporter family protein [Dehalobacter sp.]MDJ0305422.1 formate/nitrite transporter family protein [Dehalobacter sp.]OCZ50021.1 FdhC protein [Dehalobacter sp. TeCB1]QGZ99343.1 formate/nitrite transporter family protein [Dehalobacter restrictus]
MEKMFKTPSEITEGFVEYGKNKTNSSILKLLLLAILAGAFIAFAAEGSNTAIHTITSVGLGKALAGALFATGLMMVVITGAELFTGNTLIVVSCMEKESRWLKMLRNWTIVYVGNFIGSMLIVLFILYSGQFDFSAGLLGGFTIKVAAYKTGLTFPKAFFMGILCNWLVCMAVWMANAAKDITGKLLAIFFPIWLFITSGFEHCVANMYYIPAGILAKANPTWVAQAATLGVTPEKLAHLNWGTFVVNNLIPVTLGNIVGGSLFVGIIYWMSFMYKKKPTAVMDIDHLVQKKFDSAYVKSK